MAIIKIILLVVTITLSVPFIMFAFGKSDYDEAFDQLDDNAHPLKKAFPIALSLLEKFKFDYQSNQAMKLRGKLDIMYGRKYSEYYLRVTYAEAIVTTWVVLIVGFALSCFASSLKNCLVFAGVTIVVAFVLAYYYFTKASSDLEKISTVYMSQFPSVVSSVALLVSAGMILREAWEQVAYSDKKEINLQMQIVCEDIKNGMNEKEAYNQFAIRCASAEIKKFISFLTQAMDKGNKDLANVLVSQSSEMWTVRRENALKQGALAANKLLIPIMLIFVGILIMVMGPIMSNMSA